MLEVEFLEKLKLKYLLDNLGIGCGDLSTDEQRSY